MAWAYSFVSAWYCSAGVAGLGLFLVSSKAPHTGSPTSTTARPIRVRATDGPPLREQDVRLQHTPATQTRTNKISRCTSRRAGQPVPDAYGGEPFWQVPGAESLSPDSN